MPWLKCMWSQVLDLVTSASKQAGFPECERRNSNRIYECGGTALSVCPGQGLLFCVLRVTGFPVRLVLLVTLLTRGSSYSEPCVSFPQILTTLQLETTDQVLDLLVRVAQGTGQLMGQRTLGSTQSPTAMAETEGRCLQEH